MRSSSKTMEVIQTTLAVAAMILMYAFIFLIAVYINNEDNEVNEKNNFSVSNATVLSFSYNTTTITFTYNLTLFVTIPKRLEYLKYVKATASYLNHMFASKPNETLVQGFAGLRMHFNGEYIVPFTKEQLLTLNKNHMARLYNITIRVWPSKTLCYINRGEVPKLGLCDIQIPLQARVLCDWTDDDD